MGLIRWLTRNWANTREPTHLDLCPLIVSGSALETRRQVIEVIQALPRWRVETTEPELHLTRRTRMIGFVDDVLLTFTPTVAGTRIDAESRSRIGIGDLGQNRRNILELWRALATISSL